MESIESRLSRLERRTHPAPPLTPGERADRILALQQRVESGRASVVDRERWARVEELIHRAQQRQQRREPWEI